MRQRAHRRVPAALLLLVPRLRLPLLLLLLLLLLRGGCGLAERHGSNAAARRSPGFQTQDVLGGGSDGADGGEGGPAWVDALSRKGRMTVAPLFQFHQQRSGATADEGALAGSARAAASLSLGGSKKAAEVVAPPNIVYSRTGYPLAGYHFEPPFPRRELYPDGAYVPTCTVVALACGGVAGCLAGCLIS
jgi:hypothetical protein